MHKRLIGSSKVSWYWMAVLISLSLGLSNLAHAVTYYVATTGNDNNAGTAGSPFRTIQKGIDTANAGDTIEVAAGTYRERPVFDSSDGGTTAAPVTLHGAAGAIIDASNAASDSLTWTLSGGFGGGLYTAYLGYNTNAVFVNDLAIHEVDWPTASAWNTTFNIWHYERLFTYGLKNVAGMPDYDFWSALPVGWNGVRGMAMLRQDNNYLYLKCMPGGEGSTPLVIPNQTVRISPYDCVVITLDGVNNVIVDGFRLKFGYDSIKVTNGSKGIEIKNCVIKPCFNGVWIDNGSGGVSVHNVEISCDRMEDKSTKNRADNVWHMNKSHLLNTGNQDKFGIIAKETLGSMHFYDNWIHDIGVGIGTGPNLTPPASLGLDANIEINHNLVQDTYQDAIGGGRDVTNTKLHHNVLDNVLQFGRLFDLHYGPMYIYNNIMIAGPISQNGLVFYWDYSPAYAPDVYFYHNTITQIPDSPAGVEPGSVVHDAWHLNNLTQGGAAQVNHHLYNNLLLADRWIKINAQLVSGSSTNTYPLPATWDGDYNAYFSLTGTWLNNADNAMVNGVQTGTTNPPGGQAYANSRGIDLHSYWSLSSPGFTNYAAGDLSLTSGSAARGKGTNLTTEFGFTPPGQISTDAGALPYGTPMLNVPGTTGGALSAPFITSLSPITGGTAGGSMITIVGSSLTNASVSFGGTAATGISVSPNGHLLTCTLPARAAGAVNVTVTTALGTSNAKSFTYTAGGTVTTLTPLADTLVANGGPTTNYGTSNNIQVQGTAAPAYIWALLKFDLNSLGGTVTDAKLRLYKNNSTSAHVDSVFSTTDGWTETGVTWNTRPTKGTSQATLSVGAANAWYEWNVTSYIAAEVAGDKTASMYVTDEALVNMWDQFRSKEWSGFAPQLVVTTGGGGGGGSAPTLTNVSPNTGTTAGGTSVTLTGTNFISGATVSFGGTAATNVVVVSGTSITCTSPAKSAGVASVTVSTSNGTSGGVNYTYVAPAVPTLTSVSPNSGPTAGGTAVTLTGTNFIAGATVSFGGTAATNVVVVSGTSITCTAPARSAGAANVSVTTSNGTSGTQTYTYVAAPTLTTVSPNTGTTAGGTAVTLTGTNFVSGATVSFGGTAATSVVVVSATSITCVSPAKAAGTYSVTVTTTGGTSGGQNFTYTAGGGTTVTLTPTADCLVYAQTPNSNGGTQDNVQVQENGSSWSLEAYLKFSLTGVSGTTVTSAKLRLYKSSGNVATHNITAYAVADDTWTETGLTWNNKPAKGASQVATSIGNATGYYEWDITSYVNAQFAGDKTVTVNMADAVAFSNKWTQWRSKEWGTVNQRPQLVVITQ